MEKWQEIEFVDCPECGDAIEVFTMADDNECYDSDSVRCVACTYHSVISVGEDGDVWLQEVK